MMKKVLAMLEKGPIPIGKNDQNGMPLQQFDEVIHGQETYVILWHPKKKEFVASNTNQSGDCIRFKRLHEVKRIRNLKAAVENQISKILQQSKES